MAIYVIDDHPLMRDAIAMLLRRVRSGASVVELPQLIGLEKAIEVNGAPELFCLDLKLPDTSGVSGIRWIKEEFPKVPLVVISASPATEVEESCYAAGADVYIEKSAGATEIANALRGMIADEDFENSEFPVGDSTFSTVKLSKRQKQLLIMLDEGLSNREIANKLEISEHTVKVHLWRMFRRLDVKSRTQMLHYARMNGLISPS